MPRKSAVQQTEVSQSEEHNTVEKYSTLRVRVLLNLIIKILPFLLNFKSK